MGAPALPPVPNQAQGRLALRALLEGRDLLPALEALHAELGDVFRLPVPGFNPVVLAGPEAARFLLVDRRDDFRWRFPSDPVARLLRHGLLVEDGAAHAALREQISPSLHRRMLAGYAAGMERCLDEELAAWPLDAPFDVLPALRRLTLRSLTATLFGADMGPALPRLWRAILRTLDYIGPGAWIFWPGMPRPGYGWACRRLDSYLHALIVERRRAPLPGAGDALTVLIEAGLDDDLIRDQLLTLLIAGHDTNTALLAWAVYRLGRHPEVQARARAEAAGPADVPRPYLDQLINETLRLHPPIHAGNRRAARDLTFQGCTLPAGTRVLFSIYLTHRRAADWPDPRRFCPERFAPGAARTPYSFLPFGAGPRFCIGAGFAAMEARLALAGLLRRFDVSLHDRPVYGHMGATLEPRGLRVTLRRA